MYIVRTKDLHLYLLDMSQLCYYYINPHIYILLYIIVYYIASKGFEPLNVMMKTLCLRPLDYKAL